MNAAITMHLGWPRRDWNEGAVAAEAAITLSVLMLMILGIVEFGTALYSWNTMQLAVEQAGRYVMIKSGASPPCGISCAQSQMQTVLTTASVCTTPSVGQTCVNATPGAAGSPSTMVLTAAYNFNFIGNFAGIPAPFTITSQATVPLD
jgi:Flp pilus assembly protein TadG